MNYEEALVNKRDQIASSDGSLNEENTFIVPEIREEADAFIQIIVRCIVRYSDPLCKDCSSNGKFAVWINK